MLIEPFYFKFWLQSSLWHLQWIFVDQNENELWDIIANQEILSQFLIRYFIRDFFKTKMDIVSVIKN